MYIDKKFVQRMKDTYPAGTRIVHDYVGEDPCPIAPGTNGTVRIIDDIGTIHCAFDDGRCLDLISGEDSSTLNMKRSKPNLEAQVNH